MSSAPAPYATATEIMLADLVNTVQRRLNANGAPLLFAIMVWPAEQPDKVAMASTLDPTQRYEVGEAMHAVLDRWEGGETR